MASSYCRARGFKPDFGRLLGSGNDGYVWPISNSSAIKVFDREEKFNRELTCYQALQREGISKIRNFNVPQLLDFDASLYVVEMTIVSPPFLLDFGKAYYGKPQRNYSKESLDEYEEQAMKDFGDDYPEVDLAIARLKRYKIYYYDVRPGNINCEGLTPYED